jgi:hypothetical protein
MGIGDLENGEFPVMTESELVTLLSASSRNNKEYRDALKIYNEFKRLRKELGIPVNPSIDPKKVRKDLTGEDFFSLLEEMRKRTR